jgi:hypothetical protein
MAEESKKVDDVIEVVPVEVINSDGTVIKVEPKNIMKKPDEDDFDEDNIFKKTFFGMLDPEKMSKAAPSVSKLAQNFE